MGYKDFVYLKMPKEEWYKHLKKYKEDKYYKIGFCELLKGRIEYENEMLKKKDKALEAAKIKSAIANIKIYKALERLINSLFKKDINISVLAKEAGVSYNTAKKFWGKKEFDKWLKKFEKKEATLKEFLIQELAEDVIYYNASQKDKIKI
jgi:hypothetical protein